MFFTELFRTILIFLAELVLYCTDISYSGLVLTAPTFLTDLVVTVLMFLVKLVLSSTDVFY
jgi:hypothetical protein